MEQKKTTKREKYPDKMLMNLYFSEGKAWKVCKLCLCVLFVFAVFAVIVKFAFYDPWSRVQEEEQRLAEKETLLAVLMEELSEYPEVEQDYIRHTDAYLREDEQVFDRIVILEMLEETLLASASMETVTVLEDLVNIRFRGLNLDEVAALTAQLEAYEFVESVEVQTSSKDEEDSVTTMLIDIKEAWTGGGER